MILKDQHQSYKSASLFGNGSLNWPSPPQKQRPWQSQTALEHISFK